MDFSGSERGIKEKEAALKKEAAAFGLKEKLNYATDAEYGSAVSSLSAAGRYGGVDFRIRRGERSRRYIKSGTGYILVQGAKSAVAVAVRSNEEDSKIAAYTDIKHSLPALKLLKRSVSEKRKEVAKINLLLDASKPAGKKGKSLFSAALRQRSGAQTGK